MEADDQVIQTILMGLPEDIYVAVDSCETAQEIWLRVQQMMKGSDIGIQEKKANLQIAQPSMNLGQDRQMQMVKVQNVGNQNGNVNVVAARAEGYGNRNNKNQIKCYNYRGIGHIARNCTVRPRRRDAAYLKTQLLIGQKEEAVKQLQAEEFDLMAVVGDLDEIKAVNANCILMANL
ncbi:gag-pol polyprotein [Tanacetum coccineum]